MDKIGFTPTGAGVLLNWQVAEKDETKVGIILSPELQAEIDAKKNALENGITSVVSVGPDCKQVKVGDWVLLNSAGKLINVDGVQYGFVKEHQIDGIYSKEPSTKRIDEIRAQPGTLKTEKTEKKALDFKDKYKM